MVQADGSGDDAIVALARELPGRRFVVTADRELRRRCEAAGATVLGPGWLLGLLRQGRSAVIGPPGPFNRAAPLSLSRPAHWTPEEHRSRQRPPSARLTGRREVWKLW